MSVFVDASATVVEATGFVNMGRILAIDTGDPLVQADISAISRKIFIGDSIQSTDALTVVTAMFDALQNNDIWTLDDTGFNFRDIIEATKLPDGNTLYDVWWEFTSAASLPLFRFNREIYARNMPGE